MKSNKPIIKLSGEDGNVFAIIGRVAKELKRAGQADKANEFTERALTSDSYDAVLQLCFEYVRVR